MCAINRSGGPQINVALSVSAGAGPRGGPQALLGTLVRTLMQAMQGGMLGQLGCSGLGPGCPCSAGRPAFGTNPAFAAGYQAGLASARGLGGNAGMAAAFQGSLSNFLGTPNGFGFTAGASAFAGPGGAFASAF